MRAIRIREIIGWTEEVRERCILKIKWKVEKDNGREQAEIKCIFPHIVQCLPIIPALLDWKLELFC